MVLSNVLDQGGTPPERLETSAVEQGDEGCPVSNALRGNVEIRVTASLDEG